MSQEKTPEQLMFFPLAFHANHSPQQEKEEEQKITASSGLKLLEQYNFLNPDSLFLKTFAASLLKAEGWYSSACILNWKRMATKSKRFVFQLAPSVRRTEGIGSGLLPTVTTQEVEHPQATLTENQRRKTKDGTDSHSLGLADRVTLLPTVRTSSARGASVNEVAKGNPKCRLETEIAMLPTPDANDGARGATKVYDPKAKSQSGRTLVTAIGAGKRGMKLQPAFAAWMMGFPETWTELPFQSGEPKASKPTGTQ